MAGQPLPTLTLACTAGAIKHDETKNMAEELWTELPQVCRWLSCLRNAPRRLFGVLLLLQMFILPWSLACCFKFSSYHSCCYLKCSSYLLLLKMFILPFITHTHNFSTYMLLIYILILFLRNIPICNIVLMFGQIRIIYFFKCHHLLIQT